jgi:excisionase family DNA binding protein
MLRVRHLASMLGLSVRRVYQLIGTGELPSIRVGRSVLIPRPAWKSWLRERSRRALRGVRSL